MVELQGSIIRPQTEEEKKDFKLIKSRDMTDPMTKFQAQAGALEQEYMVIQKKPWSFKLAYEDFKDHLSQAVRKAQRGEPSKDAVDTFNFDKYADEKLYVLHKTAMYKEDKLLDGMKQTTPVGIVQTYYPKGHENWEMDITIEYNDMDSKEREKYLGKENKS
jgi:hypothetical protein|tara:strand:- start:877 stop:1362 length:486 start_codon:yes stop_codon:yes gene_type:complete